MSFTKSPSTFSPETTAELFRGACREPSQRRIGIEIERIGVWNDGRAFHYESGRGKFGAAELLGELGVRFGWPLVDNGSGRPVGMASCCGKVSLEPGSQLELSTETASSLISLVESTRCFERDVDAVTSPNGLSWIGIGVNPFSQLIDTDLIALPRYHIMTDYFEERKTLGTSMMRMTSSVQVNLDYTSESEAIEMLRVSLMLTPIGYALFGNSPWEVRKRSEFLSARGNIWRHTDAKRAGIIGNVFNPDFSFSEYAKLVWGVPLMFAQNSSNGFVATHGQNLIDVSNGKIPRVAVNRANEMHALRQIFTEARLKPGYIEVRSIDGQRTPMRYAAAAFWMGILYSKTARSLALKVLTTMDSNSIDELWGQSIRLGLKARIGKTDLQAVARELVEEARLTLISRGYGEETLLDPLIEVVREGLNPAQILLKKFGDEIRDVSKLIEFLGE